MTSGLNDETHYKLLSLLQENPDISQRQLAEEMGVSVGKINYCIKALLKVGHVKLNNFARSKNKLGYVYVLTPKGVKEKAQVTLRFLELKQVQYDQIQKEIVDLQREISLSKNANDS
jgi:EPS-associated MarR family transcriptional regulator